MTSVLDGEGWHEIQPPPGPRLTRFDLDYLRRRLRRALERGHICLASVLADEVLRIEGILP